MSTGIPETLPSLRMKSAEARRSVAPSPPLTWFFTSIDGYFRVAHPHYTAVVGHHWRQVTKREYGDLQCLVNGELMSADDTWWFLVLEAESDLVTDLPTLISWPNDPDGRAWLVLKARNRSSQIVGFVWVEFIGGESKRITGERRAVINEVLRTVSEKLADIPLQGSGAVPARPGAEPGLTDLPTIVRRFLLGRGVGEKGILSRAARRLQLGLDAENAAWGELSADKIGELVQIMQAEGVSAGTINKDYSTWRSFIEDLRVEGYMSDKEVHLIKRVRIPKKPRSTSLDSKAGRAMSLDEQRVLLESFGGCSRPREARDKLVVMLLLSGLRRQEVADLTIASLRRKGIAMPQLTVVGKGSKTRTVPLPPPVFEAFNRWVKLRGDGRGPLIVAINRGGSLGRTKVSGESIRIWLRDASDRAGISHVTPHDGRRTFISDGLAVADFSESAYLQRIAGHSSLDQTLGYDRRPETHADDLMVKITESRGN